MRDCAYDILKYRNVWITDDFPAQRFFHLHQKIVKESRSEAGLDPYPIKMIGNFQHLLEPMAKLFRALIKAVRRGR